MHMQQTAGTAPLGRMLRDQPFGQYKIKFIGTHQHGKKPYKGGIVDDVQYLLATKVRPATAKQGIAQMRTTRKFPTRNTRRI